MERFIWWYVLIALVGSVVVLLMIIFRIGFAWLPDDEDSNE